MTVAAAQKNVLKKKKVNLKQKNKPKKKSPKRPFGTATTGLNNGQGPYTRKNGDRGAT